MGLNPGIGYIRKQRNLNLFANGNRIRVTEFIEDSGSEKLFKFLTIDKSFRVLFNAIVKVGGWLDLGSIKETLAKLFEQANCSISYRAVCKCGNVLDYPIITERISKSTFKKKITCSSCKKEIKLDKSQYFPVFNVTEREIRRVLLVGKKIGCLKDHISAYCDSCQETQPVISNERINCKKCGEPRKISPEFFPILLALQESIESKNSKKEDKKYGGGYWLEWYVYELLKKKFPITEYGLRYKDNGSEANIDVMCVKNNKVWIIECKDSDDISDFIKNAKTLEKVGDKVCLISTIKPSETDLNTVRHLLNGKFIQVFPEDIEKIPEIIAEENLR